MRHSETSKTTRWRANARTFSLARAFRAAIALASCLLNSNPAARPMRTISPVPSAANASYVLCSTRRPALVSAAARFVVRLRNRGEYPLVGMDAASAARPNHGLCLTKRRQVVTNHHL